jgi:predicted MPP superfamily phosphohydrolase
MNKQLYPILAIIILVILTIDTYAYQGIKSTLRLFSANYGKTVKTLYWGISVLSILIISSYIIYQYKLFRTPLQNFIFISYSAKLSMTLILLTEDFYRIIKWVISKIPYFSTYITEFSRSILISNISLLTAIFSVAIILYGLIIGGHAYKIRYTKIILPNLPTAFDGLKIGQISDIHSGSFSDKNKVKKGINMLLQEKPDLIFFTGDLVNFDPNEIDQYIDIFSQLKAPLGTFSILGNHDYGEQAFKQIPQHQRNLSKIISKHKLLGWDLLMNEHRIIQKGEDKIAILGVENWGTGRFPKYGNLYQAYKNTENIPVKLLLSHDPSHWDAEVTKKYKDIDITFSGHTHGAQFGIETSKFKWSPVQYVYKYWAGLYKKGNQHLYVNRGFGYIGYLGRIGIFPEITIIKLATK